MTPQIIGSPKSKETRRVERYFKERKIGFQFMDIAQRVPSAGELEKIVRAVGSPADLIDVDSREYSRRNLAYLDFDPIEEILENPGLLRVPIVRTDNGIGVVPDEKQLSRLLGLS